MDIELIKQSVSKAGRFLPLLPDRWKPLLPDRWKPLLQLKFFKNTLSSHLNR